MLFQSVLNFRMFWFLYTRLQSSSPAGSESSLLSRMSCWRFLYLMRDYASWIVSSSFALVFPRSIIRRFFRRILFSFKLSAKFEIPLNFNEFSLSFKVLMLYTHQNDLNSSPPKSSLISHLFIFKYLKFLVSWIKCLNALRNSVTTGLH